MNPFLGLLAICLLVVPDNDEDFFLSEAKAVSAAVAKVESSVVQIEVIGVTETAAGEIAADAPTAGTVIDAGGYILASSVVTARPAASILVVLPDGTRLPAEVVAEDKGRELVMLKVASDQPLNALDWKPAEEVIVGQYAIAVGRLRPDGPAARSVGIVSALSRLEGRALQTDARISPPFYGGPLVNIHGELIGIVVPAMPEAGGTGDKSGWYDSGIAFVAPAKQIAQRLEKMKQGESIQPGRLGIVAGSSDPLADGTKISAVRIGSPAAQVELQPADEILSINDVPVSRHSQIKEVLGPLDAGSPVKIEVMREGNRLVVEPTLVAEIPPFNPQSIGVLLKADSDQAAIAATFPRSPAAIAGLQKDDVVTRLEKFAITTADDLRNRVMTLTPGREVELEVQRGEEKQVVRLTPASIAGAWPIALPELPGEVDVSHWKATEVTLPDVANKAAMLAPEEGTEAALGLLVAFAKPGTEDLIQWLEDWKDVAPKGRVIVVVISSQDAQRWNPDEADLASRVVAMIKNRYSIQPHAIALTGEGPGGTLALLAAFTDLGTFTGVTVRADIRPPAIQLRENEPDRPLHLMIQRSGEDMPPWSELLKGAGYAIVDSLPQNYEVVNFVWMLGRI